MSVAARLNKIEREVNDYMNGRYGKRRMLRLMQRLTDPDDSAANMESILVEMLTIGKRQYRRKG